MYFNDEKPMVAITGSAGKTTVKTLVASIFRQKCIVFESKDYCNTTDKTKTHAQEFSYIHQAAVLEYGMAYPGVITEHCKLIRPNIGIITNIGLAHIGNFQGSLEQLAAAKSELIYGMNPSGMLFINADDTNSRLLHTKNFSGKIFSVGIETSADYQAKDVAYTEDGMTFSVSLSGKEYSFLVPIFGKHNVYNALFGIGVADQLGFLPIEIQNGLESVRKPNHRLDVYKLRDRITVIDDTVHAHPSAMRAALDVLMAIGKKKKIAVLGSMPELGGDINVYHEDLGRYVASKNIDFLYTFGHVSEHIGKGAIASGFPTDKVKHKTPLYTRVLHRELVELIEPETTILVKGASRLNMYETVCFLKDYYKVK